jgi:hypothetical protein
MSERFIGKRRFVDGEVRLVFQDERGQHVLDEDGEPAYGIWILADEEPVDEPIIL